MTKKALRQKALDHIKNQLDDDHDEWYCTDREIVMYGINSLLQELNIKQINEEELNVVRN